MNVDGGSPSSRCVNCSVNYDEEGAFGRTRKVQEIFLDSRSLNSGQLGSNNQHLEVGRILWRIFRLNYILEDGRDEEEEDLLNPEDLSVCQKCSQGLAELWKVYNAFLDLGEQNSYLSLRIAKLDEIIEKQWRPQTGNFIQLRSDIFDDDDSKSTETEEVVSITPVAEPRIRGKIPVRVQEVMPEPSVLSLRTDENLLPSPISDLIVGDEEDNFEEEQLWGRLAVTPEIHGDLEEGDNEEKLEAASANLSLSDQDMNGLNSQSAGTCRAVSYSLFSSYRPTSHMDLPPPPVSQSASRNQSSTSSNRRKSSVMTRQCTDAIEFVPGSQHDKALSLLSSPAPLQPRILSRKRKMPVANTPLEAAILSSFEIIGELHSMPVPSTEPLALPPAKVSKVSAPKKPSKEKSKKTKAKKKGSKSKKKSRKVKTRADSARSSAQAQSNSVNSENISESTSDSPETAAKKDDSRNLEPPDAISNEFIPTVPVLKTTQVPSVSDAIAKKSQPTTQTHSERRVGKKLNPEVNNPEKESPEFQIFKAVSQPNGSKNDRTIPTIKIVKAVSSTRPSEPQNSHIVSSNVTSTTSSRIDSPKMDTQSPDADLNQGSEKFCISKSNSTAKTLENKKSKKKKKWSNSMSDGNLHTRHRLRKQKVPYPCWYCSMDFMNISDVLEHTKTIHSFDPIKSILCMQCAKINNSPQAYKYHAKTCLPPKKTTKITGAPHAGNKYRCPICLKLFLKKSFPIHLKVTHSDERPFPCDACDYKAKTPYRLKIHRFKVHNLQTSKGSKKKASGKATKLFDDATTTVEKDPNEVTTISETGVMLVGTVKLEQPSSNGISEKGISLKSRLIQEDRPFPCEVCNYRGLTQVGLQAHKKKNHQLVKCTECERMFVDKYIMQEHLRTTHDIQGVTYRKKLRTRFPAWIPLDTSGSISEKANNFEIEESSENSGNSEVDVGRGRDLTKPEAHGNPGTPCHLLEENSRGVLEVIEPGIVEPIDLSNPKHQTRELEQPIKPSNSKVIQEPLHPDPQSIPQSNDVSKHSKSEGHRKSMIPEDYRKLLDHRKFSKPEDSQKHSQSEDTRKYSKHEDPKRFSKQEDPPKYSQTKVHKKHSKSKDRKRHAKADKSPSHPEVQKHPQTESPEQSKGQEEAPAEITEDLSEPQRKQFHCQDCNSSYPSKYRLIKHKMAEHGFTKTAKFFCDRCGKGFFTEESRRVHQDTLHGLEKAFVCQFCGKEFVKTSTMKNHMKHIHPNEVNPYSCSKCGISFDDVSGLRDHAYICSQSGTGQPVKDNNATNPDGNQNPGTALT